MTASRTFLFAGGGTGGHLFPGLAVAEELRRRDPDVRILFAGSGRAIEREILAATGYDHIVLPSESTAVLRRRPWRFAWNTLRALAGARRLLRDARPAVVIGLGGFASVPVVWMAARRGVPTVLLEQNTIPGRATRWLSRRATLVCVSFEETARFLPQGTHTAVTGNPVRPQIAGLADTPSPRDESQSGPDARPILLVLGGSQGATGINDAMMTAAELRREELRGWQIVHQTGPRQVDAVRAQYERLGLSAVVEPFFSDLSEWYRRAMVVVSRAGATTLAELACAGCPAMLVPYPEAVGDHQTHNAQVFAAAGAAVIVPQQSSPHITAESLSRALETLLRAPDTRARMGEAMRRLARPRAADDVARRVWELAHVGR